MLKPFLRQIVNRQHLSRAEAEEAMSLIMEGAATPAQIAAFVVGLRLKGETVDEVAGCALAMRARASRLDTGNRDVLDTCGTGGDGANTFNISTAAAFVAAAGGALVAKHGNRAVSSQCGSADVMEALGITLSLDPGGLAHCLERAGIAFLFAPNHHAAMRHAAGPRREIAVRTVFNILGPLSNPAEARRQLLGVYAPELVPLMADVLRELGTQRAWVVHGHDGLDEVSISGPTRVAELNDGVVTTFDVTPESAGLTRHPIEAIAGRTAGENAALLLHIFEGRERGAPRDVVLLNAGAALVAAGLAGTLAEGARQAAEAVDSGAALERVQRLVTASGERARKDD
ncbi:MAG: anthranilate phosphoribosyltransferase [Candidatus Eisenbacteria bacterium]|nr:anthranilate phosphoribosyltransferase [Candidatus Eisenbacteria bacterium]